jgi:hypothetical protein
VVTAYYQAALLDKLVDHRRHGLGQTGRRPFKVEDLGDPPRQGIALVAELILHDELPGVSVESAEADGRRITYALDGAGPGAGELVRRLAEVAALRDISVLEPEIEDVVARLYADRGAPPDVPGQIPDEPALRCPRALS